MYIPNDDTQYYILWLKRLNLNIMNLPIELDKSPQSSEANE